MIAAPVFRFDAERHEYFYNDARIPSVTQLLDLGGLVNGKEYFTEESRRRGRAVHALAMDFDLGVLDLPRLESPYRGYVLGYVEACRKLLPKWEQIEVADVHPEFRFGGRIDRVGVVLERQTIAELKTAAKAKHHAIQTALQAILKSATAPCLPAERWQRLTVYLKHSGKFVVEAHEDPRDFHEAMRLIKEFC